MKRIFYISENTQKWNRFFFLVVFDDFMFLNVNNSGSLFAVTRWKIFGWKIPLIPHAVDE